MSPLHPDEREAIMRLFSDDTYARAAALALDAVVCVTTESRLLREACGAVGVKVRMM